jgi:hypothetical protein
VLCGNWIPPEEEKADADGLGAAANAARDDAAGGGDEDTPETEAGGGAKQRREDREGGSDGEVSGDDGVEPKKKAKK